MIESVAFNEDEIKRFGEKKSVFKLYSFLKTNHLSQNTVKIQL